MQAVLVMFRSDGEKRSFSIVRDMTVIGRREDCDLRIPLGESDEDAGTLESSSGAHRGNGASQGNGAGGGEPLDLDELQPVGDSEDAAFDALNADDAGPGELEIDFDAEEQGTPPAPPR